MQVLVLGEGATELGRVQPGEQPELEGALLVLVRRLIQEAAPDVPVEFRACELRAIRRLPGRLAAGPVRIGRSEHGFANKLQALLGLRAGREAGAIVMVADRDGPANGDRIADLKEGRDALQAANKPCAVGVAIEIFEAWLLADEVALRQALNAPAVQRQREPEKLSSRDEQSERNPKCRLRRIMEQSLGGVVPSYEYPAHCAAIAAVCRTSVLEERCHRGFQPFAAQVRALVGR